MSGQQSSSPEYKRMSLDKIIEAMTADLDSPAGHYVQFGVSNQANQSCNWTQYTPNQMQYMTNSTVHANPSNLQHVNPISSPVFMQNVPEYDPPTDRIYFPSQNVNHLGISQNNDLIGTIDVGDGNFINVIYGNATQIMAEQCQLNDLALYNNSQSLIDQEYGLFNQQPEIPDPTNSQAQHSNGKQLIDNLVGNWVPNQSGTYSPFGGSPNVTPLPQSTLEAKEMDDNILLCNTTEVGQKKPRFVAEVKTIKPSYSDVLTKSFPTPPSPLTTAPPKPKQECIAKKVLNKNTKNKAKITILKRQNSSGSEEHGSPKIQIFKKTPEQINSNLSRRWVSLDNLGSSMGSQNLSFDSSDNFERKKSFRSSKKNEKGETLNNSKIQNNSTKNASNLQKRPIQINNNLNTSSFSQTVPTDNKLEKNQQSSNKVKEEKKLLKEKGFRHFQAEKAQQIKKGQRIRKKENKDAAVKEVYKTVFKYLSRWSKIGLRIFFWFLHLISDVMSMSTNLVLQLGKCVWYHVVLYLKNSWMHILSTFSKIRFLNNIGKRIDDCFGSSRFAFWRRLKWKNEEKEENTSWVGGLEANIALPSTGEEAMKRLLACKGKDPYSILGVTPTCTDDDIKKYYKRQAFLVHPDKNNQPGAEEAFKILVHAFDMIGEPDRRQAFDQTRQVEAAWGELSELLSQLHKKMEQAANTIRCTNCGLRHKRTPTQRPCYAARFCAQCKIRHSVKEGDIWAESRVMGFLWHYYACMEGAVYDVTDWAGCQAGNLKHLKANTHTVQYRIVLGQRPPPHTNLSNSKKRQSEPNANKADFEDFLNNLYNQTKTGTSNNVPDPNATRGDSRKRKTKRKK